MARRRVATKAFRLSFGGTRAKKWAPTLRQAMADARYWLGYGQTRVCIDKKTPHGFVSVKCLTKR